MSTPKPACERLKNLAVALLLVEVHHCVHSDRDVPRPHDLLEHALDAPLECGFVILLDLQLAHAQSASYGYLAVVLDPEHIAFGVYNSDVGRSQTLDCR